MTFFMSKPTDPSKIMWDPDKFAVDSGRQPANPGGLPAAPSGSAASVVPGAYFPKQPSQPPPFPIPLNTGEV